MISIYLKAIHTFWQDHPCLHLGFSLLLGVGAFYFPWLFALTPFLCTRITALVIPIAYIYALTTFTPPLVLSGDAYFSISSVKKHTTSFSTSYCYSGIIRSMEGHKNIKARIFTRKKTYSAHCDYIIPKASLNEQYMLSSKSAWIAQKKTFSFAQLRFEVKSRIKRHLRKHYKGLNYHLLAALATGDVESRELRHYFTHLGLAHIIAISGFHFALLAGIFSLVLRPPLLLIAALSLYAFYIGPSPSLARAHIAISLLLFAKYFMLRTTSLNALGAALCSALILEPHIVTNLAFQLSFSATLGILLYYGPCEKWLYALLPKRNATELENFSLLDKHGYILSAFIRKAFALNIAVHTITLPLLLFHFHSFPILSLLYNLFVPLLITFPLALLFLPFLSPLTNAITSFVIMLISFPPKKFAFELSVPIMSESLLFPLLFAGIMYGIYLQREPDLIPLTTY